MKQKMMHKSSIPCLICVALIFLGSGAMAATVPPQVLVDEAMVHMKAGEPKQAIIKLEAARMLRPNDLRLIYQLGLAYYTQGSLENSIAHIDTAQDLWRQAIEMIPSDGDRMLANTLNDIVERADVRKEEIDELHMLERTQESPPSVLDRKLRSARKLLKRGLNDQAAEIYRELMDEHNGDPRAFTEMGGLVYSMGRILWAEHYYDQALQRDPNYEPARTAMVKLYESLEALRLEGFETLVRKAH